MKTFAIINQKGGVAKSTTANALGAGLKRKGYRVLLIDLDAQQNLTYVMDSLGAVPTALEVLTGASTAAEAVQHTAQGDIIPATAGLANADLLITEVGKEFKLKEALKPLAGLYDYVIIDTPPALGVLTINALTAADEVIIPAQADAYSLQGIGQLANTITAVKRYCNNGLIIKGLLVTRYNGRSILSRDMGEMLEETAQALHTKVFASRIRECIAIKEAQANRQNIFDYAPKSNGAKDYLEFIEEVISDHTEGRA